MNTIDTNNVLQQIRSFNLDVPTIADTKPPGTQSAEFGNSLRTAIDNVNEMQQHAGDLKKAFESGVGSASLAEVMIASQKADLSFRAMTEVRNKLVTAYQDIMNMPV